MPSDMAFRHMVLGTICNGDRAVRQICEIAFETLDIIRITGLVYEANIASRKVLERNGFLLEGKMEKAVIKNNNIFDLCIYGKVR